MEIKLSKKVKTEIKLLKDKEGRNYANKRRIHR